MKVGARWETSRTLEWVLKKDLLPVQQNPSPFRPPSPIKTHFCTDLHLKTSLYPVSTYCIQKFQNIHTTQVSKYVLSHQKVFVRGYGKTGSLCTDLSDPLTSAFPRCFALWARITKNTDWSTGPLARPFARSLAPLTRLLALDCSLHSRPLLRSLANSLTSLTPSLVGQWMIGWLFFCVFFYFRP